MANLNENYPDLNQLFGNMSMLPRQLGMEQYGRAQRAQDQNYRSATQEFDLNAQMNPLKVQQQQISNDIELAKLPGFQADSSMKQDQATLSRNTLSDRERAERSKLITQMSDDDLKQLGNHAQTLAMSMNPQERLIGETLLAQHKDIIAEKAKQKYMSDRRMAEERLAQEGREALERMRIDAGKYKKGQGSVTIEEQLKSGKLSYEKGAVLLNNAAYMAELEGEQEKADHYRTLATQYAAKANELKAAGVNVPKAGSADLGGLGVPAVAPQPATPLVSPIPKPQQQSPGLPGDIARTREETQLKQAVEAQGGQYDPSKFEYRVNPQTGKVQSRPRKQ